MTWTPIAASQTEFVNHRRYFSHKMLRALFRLTARACAGVVSLAGCDQVKEAMGRDAPVSRWVIDSTLLANKPDVLYRLVPWGEGTAQVVPIATIGTAGFRELHLGSRGWRAFDLEYLQSRASITPLRGGQPAGAFASHRGFWEPTPFDTTITCKPPIAVGLATLTGANVSLATNRPPQPLKYQTQLSSADLDKALQAIPLLVAPMTGISSSMLQRYNRKVHVISSATGPNPTILVEYNDPVPPADSLQPIGERPRHLIVILDKGIYNYRTSFTYSSLGNRKDKPRLAYLDAADVNGDGLVELFFGLRDAPSARYTRVMRYESEAWREAMTYLGYLCER